MAEHTPGPWRISPKSCLYGAVVADTSTRTRAATADEAAQDVSEIAAYGGYIIAESIAPRNRLLIAAAPDLLEAAEFALSVIKHNGIFELSERMAVDRLETAISAAYGGTDNA